MKIIKKDYFYDTSDDTNEANRLLFNLFRELCTYYGNDNLLAVTDYPEDEECDIGERVTMYKKDGKFYILNSFDIPMKPYVGITPDESDICMPLPSARKMLLQMEQAYFDQPDEINVTWQPDGSAHFEWKPTYLHRAKLIQKAKNLYSVDSETFTQDFIIADFISLLLPLLEANKDRELRMIWAPKEEPFTLGPIHFSSEIQERGWKGTLFMKSTYLPVEPLALSLEDVRFLYRFTIRVLQEQTPYIYLKWYKNHSFALEWE